MSFIVYCTAFILLGFVIGRWVALIPAAIAFPLYVGGLHAEWWGHGVGDGWEYGVVFATLVAIVATAAGVAARRARVSFAAR